LVAGVDDVAAGRRQDDRPLARADVDAVVAPRRGKG
jgi:hypothetical protein